MDDLNKAEVGRGIGHGVWLEEVEGTPEYFSPAPKVGTFSFTVLSMLGSARWRICKD